MLRDEPTLLRRYCLCGASLLGRAAPADLAAALLTAWDGLHGGPGHGAATASQARNARRRADWVAVDPQPKED